MKYDEQELHDKIELENKTKKITKTIIYIILIITFIINAILLFQNMFQKDGNKKIFNIYFFNIISGSMKPTINENDVILVKKCNIDEINIDDVISFIKEEKIITHRVIEVIKEEGTTRFRTKGDNNEIRDDFIVDFSEIYGKQLFKIPGIGVIVEYIQKTNGIINLTILILIIFIFIGVKDKKKNIRRTKRRKYEIKKLRDNYN